MIEAGGLRRTGRFVAADKFRKENIMNLTFPRKFTQGQKVGKVDIYGELFLWPNGYFQYMVHMRNSDPLNGNSITASFALLDETHAPLGIYGMPADKGLSVAAGRRSDELFGKVHPEKLPQTAAVALLFRRQGQELDAASLRDLATAGSELMLCPIPD
jgi:hypothetical protein